MGWQETLGTAGHLSRDERRSPQEWGSISPGIREHCSWENHQSRNGGTLPQGEFLPPGIRKHSPREINHPRNGKVSPQELECITPRGLHHPRDRGSIVPGGSITGGTPPSSLLLTGGPRRTFSAGLPPGQSQASAPPRAGSSCCRAGARVLLRGHDLAAGRAPQAGAELILAGGSYSRGLTLVKGGREGDRATSPLPTCPWRYHGKGRCWRGLVMSPEGTPTAHSPALLSRGRPARLTRGDFGVPIDCSHSACPLGTAPALWWPQRGSCSPAHSIPKGSFWGGGAGLPAPLPLYF